MKKIFKFIAFLITSSIFSQNSEVEVVDLKPVFHDYKFPEVQIKDNEKVQDKINTVLQLLYLEHLPRVFKDNPYEKLKITEDFIEYTTIFQDWQKNETPKNILSLNILGKLNTELIEKFSSNINFDLRTGNKIYEDQILTQEGIKTNTSILNEKVASEILKLIEGIKNKKPSNSEEKEKIEYKIKLYEELVSEKNRTPIESYKFKFKKDKITFIKSISGLVVNNVLEYSTFEIDFTYKEIEKHLTTYGKSLCFDNSEETNPPTLQGKMYKGKIDDKHPITAIILKIDSNKSSTIFYWYDEYKLPILWTGSFEINKFHLYEIRDINSEIIINANYDENKIIGTWENETTNETLKLELSEY